MKEGEEEIPIDSPAVSDNVKLIVLQVLALCCCYIFIKAQIKLV